MADTDNIARRGINAVESIFLGMNWKFREQPISDYGIDAHVEPCGPDGSPTGQLIALQIKSGASYFKKQGSDYVFRGNARHLRYWRNHVLPVFIILHDPETNLTLWQRIDHHLVHEGRNGRWSITIPTTQTLDKSSADYIRNGIASDPASVRRFRLALDLPLIREIAARSIKEDIFLIIDEWVNKTLNFRETKVTFGDPDAEPEYTVDTWLPQGELNELMAEYFPWLDYEYEHEIEDGSGEVEGHTLRVELNELGTGLLTVETFVEEGKEVGTLEPWYEDQSDSIVERYGSDDDWDRN